MRKIAIFILLISTLVGCTHENQSTNKKTIFVTITPLKSIIAEITCNDFEIEVFVPKGASPETYDPTAKQLTAASDAQMLFSTGLINFEQQLTSRLDGTTEIVDLSQGIEVLAGCCSHNHKHNHSHAHGIDPHIWTSPRALQTMVRTAHSAIKRLYPDSAKYDTAADNLIARLDELDSYCEQSITNADVKVMMIYHPAYTYYAHDYGIDQIAIEQDGKDPSSSNSIFSIECDVINPSWQTIKGNNTSLCSAILCAISKLSYASWLFSENSIIHPLSLTPIASE